MTDPCDPDYKTEDLVRAMSDSSFYDHSVQKITHVDTHISTIFLTGKFAYKIKKAVNLGFLDFTSLAKRKHYCEEELRLNRRFAPDLYLGVTPIVFDNGRFSLQRNNNHIVEYAVKMRQFDRQQELDRLIDNGLLEEEQIEELGRTIAAFHARASIAETGSEFGGPEAVIAPMRANFRILLSGMPDLRYRDKLEYLASWTEQRFSASTDFITYRKQHEKIRECHGDLHLGNIALIDGKVTPFDCIEFNPSFYWIDIISEMAFPVMDLEIRGKPELANLLLNIWLSETGDYGGLRILDFYKVYRAMVRTKVNMLLFRQKPPDSTAWRECKKYIDLADQYTAGRQPRLLITHGLSGSGKTWRSKKLAMTLNAIHIRSDVERKRLAGIDALKRRPGPAIKSGLYSPEHSRLTYQQLEKLARNIIQAGYSVIVDAAFLQRRERDRFHQLANLLAVPYCILHFETPVEIMKQRVRQRTASNQDASDADIKVLNYQLSHYIPLAKDEPAIVIFHNMEDARITGRINTVTAKN